MRPVLFLDVDGVLNRHQYNPDAQSSTLDRACVDVLNSVIVRTDCAIVLSSSWRYAVIGGDLTLRGFEYMLRTHLVFAADRLIGMTAPDEHIALRGDQIMAYVRGALAGRQWAAVDDTPCDSMKQLGRRFVLTDSDSGLVPEDGRRLIDLLTEPA